ncbi:MAG: hypothetical protein FIB06_05615 [Betaproteobacteria bacterium]|nr:hypothetical protein [Betaproteobacteria bacterium]
MPRIVRERYEDGVLVERTVEGSTFKPRKWLMLFAHLTIAASLALLAAVAVLDSLAMRTSLGDEAAPASCEEAPRFKS